MGACFLCLDPAAGIGAADVCSTVVANSVVVGIGVRTGCLGGAAISTLIVIFLGVVTAKLTSKLKQIQEDTAEAKEQVTNSHSANFRDEVTQIVPDVKVIEDHPQQDKRDPRIS